MSSAAHETSPKWIRYAPEFVQRKLGAQPGLIGNLHNIVWLLADKVLRIVIAVAIGAWVARYLGPDQFGKLNYAITIVAVFGVICQLGLDAVVVRDIAFDREAAPAILGTTFRLRLCLSAIIWLMCMSSIFVLGAADQTPLLLTAILAGALIFQSADTVDLWFQSQTQSRRTVVARIASYVIGGSIKVLLILSRASIVAFAVVVLIEGVIASIGLWLAYRRLPAPEKWRWDTTLAKRLFHESWPYMLSSLAVVTYMRIDQIMIREMVSNYELGVYSSAIALSSALYFIPVAISLTLAPSISRLKNCDAAGFENRIRLLYSLMWWVSIPLAVTISLLAYPIVILLYGDEFVAGSSILAIHVFSLIPLSLGTAQANWLVNERRGRIALGRTLLGGIASVSLNFWLIPLYGGKGAAISAVIAFSVAAIFSNLLFAPQVFRVQMTSLFVPFKLLKKIL